MVISRTFGMQPTDAHLAWMMRENNGEALGDACVRRAVQRWGEAIVIRRYNRCALLYQLSGDFHQSVACR